MRRPSSLLCVAALGLTGFATLSPATAAPAAQSSSTAAAAVPDELLVGYVAGATDADRERARSRAAAQAQERVVAAGADRLEVELVRLPRGKDRDQAVAELQSDPAVAYAEPNYLLSHQVTVTDPIYTSTDPAKDLWGMYGELTTPANKFGSNAGQAWTTTTGSKSVYVGVIDEGIQFTHPDLDGQVWSNPGDPTFNGVDEDRNGLVDDVHGWDFANNDSSIYDGGKSGGADDHGTHVSGTIGGEANNSGVVGLNHNVTLISGKFLGRSGGSLANAVKAVDYFTNLKTTKGIDIVATSNSWGGGGFSQSLLDAIVRGAKADILFIAAAGNSGSDNDATASYPSGYDTTAGAGFDAVIAVAAIDRNGGLASFSQYGAKTVDLGAPGVGVWSTTALNTYSSYNGTSMATPHVTGAAALYQAAFPAATAAQIRSALLTSAVPTPSLAGKTVTGGRLDAAAALLR